MKVTSNAARLVGQVLAGEVWPALADRHGFRVGPDGQPFSLPGMGGVTLGVHCGDPATGYASRATWNPAPRCGTSTPGRTWPCSS